ncbi:centromere protein U isoform X1 [Malaclemys terrapin pileata]|uniref:centromere protein U isoform X1 n=1 Tax=Malaclemys terrapin pileata TaxID=2991368 RepID=UPI0023A7CFF4|nr:centromere protein U isoform X1 [Malaclemys terrapin pileata]XP_053887168.1 centromere protein U isoform X1 [Malaclemys terrapin pileata]XP_053887169.1 centromere protein U isoform X1 [Malaclemys terrapin pileata]XP_053887170.1 centromere protein U isoform X1 [Malaclemys terrapin pileata]
MDKKRKMHGKSHMPALEKTSKKTLKRNKLDLDVEDIALIPTQEYKAKSHPRSKLLPCEEPDVSRILKITESGQVEEPDDSFDHPLHSTAVDAGGNVELQEEEHMSASDSSPQGKHAETRKNQCSLKMAEDNKSETDDSEDESLKENKIQKKISGNAMTNVEESKLPSALALGNSSSESNISNKVTDLVKKLNAQKKPKNSVKSHMKPKKSSQKSALDPSADDSPCSIQIWCPKGLKRFPQDITELDVVLAEYEKITADYKQRVESRICREAIEGFYSGFKDQLTNTITEVQELKDLKRKNAKVITDINKKRRRLLEVREELIRTGPQLKQLQREYAELQERESSLRNATQFLTDLKEMQQRYRNCREDHPQEKVVYGTSSIPALLMESQLILRAESHFQNISTRLQEVLNLQKKELPEKF